jgi:hypothetical protein
MPLGDSPGAASQNTRSRPRVGGASRGCARGVMSARYRLRSNNGGWTTRCEPLRRSFNRLGWSAGTNAGQVAFAGSCGRLRAAEVKTTGAPHGETPRPCAYVRVADISSS